MPSHKTTDDHLLANLTTPLRNNYFYGKLMDVKHFQMEQDYFNRKRWLLNRLTLGMGVVCGLEVVRSPKDQNLLCVGPGVAIDGLGREIIVPSPSQPIDPRILTDGNGRPLEGKSKSPEQVTICLAYHECEDEWVPVMVGECEPEPKSAPSTILERYSILVHEGTPAPLPDPEELCKALLTKKKGIATLRQSLCAVSSKACAEAPGDPCVPLAVVTLREKGLIGVKDLDCCTYRPIVYSNAVLLDLILCLAERKADKKK
jgi:hypothetical protein